MQDVFNLIVDYFIPFVITLSIVVFVHEFGHFWVARRCGVKVVSFSIGMGSELFGRTDKHGTRWKFSSLPIGGYVKMFGDADPASTPDAAALQTMTDEERKTAFYHKNVWQRLAIIIAGPAANYLFAIVVLFFMFIFMGQPFTRPVLDSVTAGSAAAEAGLAPGDTILSVDGEKIEKFSELQRKTALSAGQPMQLQVKRGDQMLPITVTPKIVEVEDRFGNINKMPRMGVTTTTRTEDYKKLSVGEAIPEVFSTVWGLTRDTVLVLKQIIVGTRSSDELGGALRIAKMSGDVAKNRDLGDAIWFLVLLSVNLGFINLLPIPLLDGGHIMFYLAEAVRRKPLSERIQEYAARLGFGTVLFLMGFTLWNDLVHLKIIAYLRNLFT